LDAAHQVVLLAPDEAASYDLLGWLYLSSGLQTEAETSLQRALAMDADLASAHLHLAMLYLQRGNYSDAREQLLLARDLDPSSADGQLAAQMLGQYFP
jgi:tetratricopeptide (TPR) repeat protein